MKTTIEIDDPLLNVVRETAEREHVEVPSNAAAY